MQTAAVPDVENDDQIILDGEQVPVSMLPIAIEHLTHLVGKIVIFRRKPAALWST